VLSDLETWLNLIEQRHPATIKLGLDRINAVADVYKLTDFSVPVITVTGTNGKGSCIAYLESILKEAGYRVAAYTSPHLYHFNERLRINGKTPPDSLWCEAFEFIERATHQAGVELTFFEFITLAAFYHLQKIPLDVVLLEVGLGGRLDAVNSVDADLAIITTIGLDHQAYLGHTREAIAREKAGIFRQGRPAIIGDANPPLSLIKEAEKHSVVLHSIPTMTLVCQPLINNCSAHLIQPSATCALMALQCLSSCLPVSTDAIKKGLSHTQLKGRFQPISTPYSVILDVAHNPCAAAWLDTRLNQLSPVKKTYAVFSMLNDKAIKETIEPLKNTVDGWFIAPLKETPRAASLHCMQQAFDELGIQDVMSCRTIAFAYRQAINAMKERPLNETRLVVFGSFYTVSAIPLAQSLD